MHGHYRGSIVLILLIVECSIIDADSSVYGNGNVLKVSLTQRGYIQFLRYEVYVPELVDFTSCIWIKSMNSTHSQSLLSYSRHESERLIRLWLSPHGFYINLEILGTHVMTSHIGLQLDEWYHVCQTWSAVDGLWGLYKNSLLIATGEIKDPKIRGRHIPGGGDVVIGQEYTDFDKGLEDGIEGEIFGFNLLGNSQIIGAPPRPHHHHPHPYHRRPPAPWGHRLQRVETASNRRAFDLIPVVHQPKLFRQSKSALDFVHTCYKQCAGGRGSPSWSKHLLIAWARTPVRVFGGAVMKNAHPVCAAF